jgi:23S rRNA (guanosine2251-2'-O)-methyltransferase
VSADTSVARGAGLGDEDEVSRSAHPRDRFIPVYGRKPVLEALEDRRLRIDKLLVAKNARGAFLAEILQAARARGLEVQRVAARAVTRVSKNGRQDQGVVADVEAPQMDDVAHGLARLDPRAPATLLALDGVTTPGNVGLCLRSAVAAGVDGILLPRRGTSGLNPLVVKASAGLVFQAPILRCETLADGLAAARAHGLSLVGLAGEAALDLYAAELPRRAVYVLGNETEGLAAETRASLDLAVRIPMAPGVESLNVACAATLVAFEARRRSAGGR